MASFEEEAFARAQQMNLRGRKSVSPAPEFSPQPKPRQADKPKALPNQAPPQATAEGNILDRMFHDKDKSIILILLVLLVDEKTDPALIMALMYLLM